MSEDGWISVVNQKKKRYLEKRCFKRRWSELKMNYPHILLPNRALRIKKKLNVDGLFECLTSDEWIDYQKQGWVYIKVLKPVNVDKIPEDTDEKEYSTLSLNNGWKDKVLFYRTKHIITKSKAKKVNFRVNIITEPPQ